MSKFLVSFTGVNGYNAISIPILKVGDKLLEAQRFDLSITQLQSDATTSFNSIVTTDGELFHKVSNDSVYSFIAVFERDIVVI